MSACRLRHGLLLAAVLANPAWPVETPSQAGAEQAGSQSSSCSYTLQIESADDLAELEHQAQYLANVLPIKIRIIKQGGQYTVRSGKTTQYDEFDSYLMGLKALGFSSANIVCVQTEQEELLKTFSSDAPDSIQKSSDQRHILQSQQDKPLPVLKLNPILARQAEENPAQATKVPQPLETKEAEEPIQNQTASKSPLRNKPEDPCSGVDKQWARAQAQLRNNREQAVRGYTAIITGCRKQDIVVATLQKSSAGLSGEEYNHLLNAAADFLPAGEIQRMAYLRLKNNYLENTAESKQPEVQAALYQGLEQFQDADLAVIVAWRNFEQTHYREALAWFDKAGQWQPGHADVVQGRMLSLEKLGDYDAALAHYAAATPDVRLNAIAGRLYKIKAWQAIQEQDFNQGQGYLTKAQAILGGDEREAHEIDAWIADGTRDYGKAAGLFDGLYRLQPESKYAEAYVRNQSQVDANVLVAKAQQEGGLLLDEYRSHQSRQQYYRKLFLAAEHTSAKAFPELQNIDSASAELGVLARHKSGQAGLGQLDIVKTPVAGGAFTVGGVHRFEISLSRVELSAGHAGQADVPGVTNQLTDALESDVAYQLSGEFSPHVRLGHTPSGGVIAPAVTFDAGFVQQTGRGNWSVDLYSQPIRQSILSYTGIRDPNGVLNNGLAGAGSLAWGRVLRSGIKTGGYVSFGPTSGISVSAEAVLLTGTNVAENTAFAAAVQPGFNIPNAYFDYLSVGPSFAYEHYEKNLSHFTFGQGGYFSPEHYINSGLGLQFLSKEGQPLVFKGHVNAGVQITQLANSPLFPTLAPNGQSFQDNKGFVLSDAIDVELKGIWLVAPNIQLGAGAAFRRTSNYEDYSGGLFVRFLLKNRKGSFSTDIPSSLFGDIQAY